MAFLQPVTVIRSHLPPFDFTLRVHTCFRRSSKGFLEIPKSRQCKRKQRGFTEKITSFTRWRCLTGILTVVFFPLLCSFLSFFTSICHCLYSLTLYTPDPLTHISIFLFFHFSPLPLFLSPLLFFLFLFFATVGVCSSWQRSIVCLMWFPEVLNCSPWPLFLSSVDLLSL